MQPDPGSPSVPPAGPPPAPPTTPTSGAGDCRPIARRRTNAGAGAALLAALRAAAGVAVIGSVLLGLCEHLVASAFSSSAGDDAPWPAALVLAATGRIITTHLTLWLPVFLIWGVGYWCVRRRRPTAAPEPFFLALYVALAAGVVVPADLALAGNDSTLYLILAMAVSLAFAALVYFLARAIRRRAARLFRGLFALAAVLAVAFAALAFVLFVRSPLLDPGGYHAPPLPPTAAPGSGPNILWVVLDTVRADRLGPYGCPAPTTPFLDEFASQCLVFDRAVADGMWTLPSHASMFTGLPVRQHGVGGPTRRLDDSFPTLAETLRNSGYRTALFSNNPLVGPGTGLSRGFATARVVWNFHRRSRFSLEFLCERWGITPPLPWLDLDCGAALTNHLIARWLGQQSGSPLLLFVNYMEAHLPYRSPQACRRQFLPGDQLHRSYDLRYSVYGDLEDWLTFGANVDGYDALLPGDREVIKRQYDAAVRYLDGRVRELVTMFAQRGLLDHTLIVITSDHGEYLDTHGMWSHHFLLYDDLTRVPLLIRPPGPPRPGRIAAPVQLSDLYPTLLHAAVGTQPGDLNPHARDLLAHPEPGSAERIVVTEHFGAARPLAQRLLAKSDPDLRRRASPQLAAVTTRYKYVRSADGTRELYDLANDPGEQRNVEFAHWKEAERLRKFLEWWEKTVPRYQSPAGTRLPEADALEALKALGYVVDD